MNYNCKIVANIASFSIYQYTHELWNTDYGEREYSLKIIYSNLPYSFLTNLNGYE